MKVQDVIIRPINTEKTAQLSELDQVVFKVRKGTNKHQIKNAVETLFDVQVVSVRTMTIPGKPRRFGRMLGRTPSYKKAVIQLAEGQAFDLFALDVEGEHGVV